MGLFVAVLLGALGVALIVVGVKGSASKAFNTVVGPSGKAAKK